MTLVLIVCEQHWRVQIIPMLSGDATKDTPPDLASYLFKERIVYLVRPSQLSPRAETFPSISEAACRVFSICA